MLLVPAGMQGKLLLLFSRRDAERAEINMMVSEIGCFLIPATIKNLRMENTRHLQDAWCFFGAASAAAFGDRGQ